MRSLHRAVLDLWGLSPLRVQRWETAPRNSHWLVRLDDGDAFLTRFHSERSLEDARWQIEVMNRFRAQGWPVPDPLADPISLEGYVWVLFRRMPGRHRAVSFAALTPERQREVGELIAQLQASTGHLADVGQRPDMHRVDELDRVSPSAEAVFARWEHRRPEEIGILRSHWEKTREMFGVLEPERFPKLLIHADVAPWNLLYTRGRLTGLIDFEFAHLDLRVADLVHSWRGRHDEVVHGYMKAADLDDEERALITPVRWAWLVAAARADLLRAGDNEPNLEWVMTQIVRRSPLMVL